MHFPCLLDPESGEWENDVLSPNDYEKSCECDDLRHAIVPKICS